MLLFFVQINDMADENLTETVMQTKPNRATF